MLPPLTQASSIPSGRKLDRIIFQSGLAGLELHLGHKGDQCPSNTESDIYYTENEDVTEGAEFEADNSDNELDADMIFTETELRMADNFAPDLGGLDDANDKN